MIGLHGDGFEFI